MTPEERVEKINCYFKKEYRFELMPSQVSQIAAEIRETVEDAERELLSNGTFAQRCFDEGKAEAYEDAAKIVENHLGRPCTLVWHCAANAKVIRARAKEIL